MQDRLKSRCKFITLLGKYAQQKQVGWEVIFSELGFAGSRCVSPGGSSRAAPSCSEASWGFNCASKVLLTSQCKNMAFGRGKSNHTLARCAFFFTNTVLQKSLKHNVVMKVLINTIGKKIHTLVKENTPWPCCHKIRQECGFTQKAAFFSISLCFLPHCHANIGRQVRLIPPNTYQEIYDTHTCLNF